MALDIRFAVLVYLLASLNYCKCQPCSNSDSIVIDGEKYENGSIFHNGIEYTQGQWYEEQTEDSPAQIRGCICLIKNCLWKCCQTSEAKLGRECGPSSDERVNPFNPHVYDHTTLLHGVSAIDYFWYMHGYPCEDKYFADTNSKDENNTMFLQQNGELFQPYLEQPILVKRGGFCMDYFASDPSDPTNSRWTPGVMAVVCFESEELSKQDETLNIVYAIGMLLSVPFLLVTFLVYAVVPELRNLHGMCLMAYCFGMLVGYSLLAYLMLSKSAVDVSMTTCITLAFAVFYFMQTTFFWMNVMCFDIWRTFSGYAGKRSGRPDWVRFALYGVYAWGMPFILTGIVSIMQFHGGIPTHHIRPQFGLRRCWFSDWKAELVYMYVPVLIVVIINIVLFAATAHRIHSIRQETAILKGSESARSDQYNRDKQRYVLYLKLFVVMGANWTVEVVSFLTGFSWFWIVTDVANTALGVFIFVIFVWKNKVKTLLLKRYRSLRSGGAASTSRSSKWMDKTMSQTEETRLQDEQTRLQDLR